ncbi:adenylyl-sulfate kinase [Solicola gregarius]|uniref:adenylyl-sulfate kinase n=1 Tax=Solicola gregarius TaxID=2908642 RepID=A0AA46YMW1_9ACTN|nr:adenylyl-sulfate kinase [Solicola gregarius]UYM06881.1 adenylyl-sulfate kinase [Solicola gregarius]
MTRPQWTPTPRELADLELQLTGALPGHDGFSVTTTGDFAESVDDAVELIDPEGVPLALLSVDAREPADGATTLTGSVEALSPNEFGAFRRYHRSPADVRAEHADAFAVPVVAPPTLADVAAINARADQTAKTPLLLAYTGPGTPHGVSAPALVRTTLAAARDIPGAVVVAVAVAARDDADADVRFRAGVAAAYADETLTLAAEGERSAAVEAIRRHDHPPRSERGLVIFFTGLSGSGKSTLARALYDLIVERGERTVTSLDGDVVRHHLSKGLGFSKEDRETNIARIGWVAAEIARHHGVAICSPIAPFDSTRRLVRQLVDDAGGGFALIHVATPLEECERRDRKGLYAKARAGIIPEFTGISSPYEEPDDALVRVDTTGRTIEDALSDVVKGLTGAGWLGFGNG